jgi:3-phenylpropionate/cinnamic acid dioxygenase small subunit
VTAARVERLCYEYVRAVDRKDMEGWAGLFAADGAYFVVARENYERSLPIAFIYDDSRARIEDLVTYVRKIWAGHYDEYQPRHLLSNVLVEELEGQTYRASAHFAVYVTEEEGTSGLLAVGEYDDLVVLEDGVPRFRRKTCILDTNVLPRYFVYPL